MLNFDNQSLWIVAAVFLVSGAVVWAAGWRLARYTDAVATKTGLGQAFMGMLMLGGITSLPEIATVSTASYTGNAPLAVNNLLGTASANIILLAVGDAILGRGSLTAGVGKPSTLFQGVLGMVLMGIAAAGVIANDASLFGLGVGTWSTVLLVGCIGALWLSSRYERHHGWEAVGDHARERENGGGRESGADQQSGGDQQNEKSASKQDDRSVAGLSWRIGLVALFILAGGFFLAQTGDAIARKTGLGAGLVGLVLVGFATSLPELSSITSALRIHRYDMAVGDVFGTNLFNIALIFLADAVYRGEPVLAHAGPFEAVAAILALILTGAFVLGLLQRRDRTVFRMGYDSIAILVLYLAGLAVLYGLQGRAA